MMPNEVIEVPTPGQRLEAQAVISERLRLFALQVSLEMTASDAAKILTWLDSEGFTETCQSPTSTGIETPMLAP